MASALPRDEGLDLLFGAIAEAIANVDNRQLADGWGIAFIERLSFLMARAAKLSCAIAAPSERRRRKQGNQIVGWE